MIRIEDAPCFGVAERTETDEAAVVKLCPLLVVLACASAAVGVRAEVEFAGYMRTPRGEDRFVLTDLTAKKTSEWVGLGASFGAYRVIGYEAMSETLVVEKEGATSRLRLKRAVVLSAAKARSEAMPTEEEIEASRATMQLAQAMQARSYERDRLNGRASELRRSHPEDHSERQEVERKLAEIRKEMTRGLLEMDRSYRPTLVRQIANSAGNPAAQARFQGQLRSLDERLAKADAAVESAPPAATSSPR